MSEPPEWEKLMNEVFAPDSSDDDEDVKPEVVNGAVAYVPPPPQRHVILKTDREIIFDEDKLRKRTPKETFKGRRNGLEKHHKDAQSARLEEKEEMLMALLVSMEPELKEVSGIKPFLEKYEQMVLAQMESAENEHLIPFGEDIFIMAGMMCGVMRGNEEHRLRKVAHFQLVNYHQQAARTLAKRRIEERERRIAEKRKAEEEAADLRRMTEQEEKRRMEEEMDEQAEKEAEEMRDQLHFDAMRYENLVMNGFDEETAYATCMAQARERRIESDMGVQIVSSPPRSVLDPSDMLRVDMNRLKLEEELQVYSSSYADYEDDVEMVEEPADGSGVQQEEEEAAAAGDAAEPMDVEVEEQREEEPVRQERPPQAPAAAPAAAAAAAARPAPTLSSSSISAALMPCSKKAILRDLKKRLTLNQLVSLVDAYRVRQDVLFRAAERARREELRSQTEEPELERVARYVGYDVLPVPQQKEEPVPEVDVGEVKPTRSILKKPAPGEPAILTDLVGYSTVFRDERVRAGLICKVEERLQLKAMQQRVDDDMTGKALARNRMQLREKLEKMKQRKSSEGVKRVTFAPPDDERHTMRVYVMQSVCEGVHEDEDWTIVERDANKWMRPGFDATDYGQDMFRIDLPLRELRTLVNTDFRANNTPTPTIQYRAMLGEPYMSTDKRKTIKSEGTKLSQLICVSPRNDSIYSAHQRQALPLERRRCLRKLFEVGHRDYPVFREMRSLSTTSIMNKWRACAVRMIEHGFDIGHRPYMRGTINNAGMLHLVLADSLLDRVNPLRFPQTYFLLHQRPLTLSSSFDILARDISAKALMGGALSTRRGSTEPFLTVQRAVMQNIEWFIWAYGFDDIFFEGVPVEAAATRVADHVAATILLVDEAYRVVSRTHPITVTQKFRVFKLPTRGMADKIKNGIKKFNSVLVEKLRRFGRTHDVRVLRWEPSDTIKAVKAYHEADQNAPSNIFHPVHTFAETARRTCAMRKSRIFNIEEANALYHLHRSTRAARGLNPEDVDLVY